MHQVPGQPQLLLGRRDLPAAAWADIAATAAESARARPEGELQTVRLLPGKAAWRGFDTCFQGSPLEFRHLRRGIRAPAILDAGYIPSLQT